MLTALIVVAITTLCICDFVVLGLVAFYVYTYRSHFHPAAPSDPVPKGDSFAQGESAEQIKARREYIEQEKAFQSMMNFNIEQAYGMSGEPLEEISE